MGFFKKFAKAITNPQTLIAAAVTTAIIVASGGTMFGSIAATFAVVAGSSAALAALAPTPDLPDFSSFISEGSNRTQMIKQPIVNRRVVYGEIRVSGPLAFMETTESDKFLHLIVLLGSHESNAIGTVFLNDQALTLDGSGNCTAPSQFANKVRIRKFLGTDTQSADPDLISESAKWTANHTLAGITYIYARLEFDGDAFPNGIPNISAIVQGKKIKDSTGNTVYNHNPAYVIRDFLRDTKFGLSVPDSEIDDTSFDAAATICDETIPLAAGGTEKKYDFHGSIESNNSPKETLTRMLTSCGGIIFYANGKFKIKVAKFVSPTITLDEDNLRSGLTVETKRSVRENYNAVKGVFSPASTNYIPTDYPVVESSTFLAEDNNIKQFLNLDLPYTQTSTMAQRLAKIALFRERQSIAITASFDLNAFQLDIGDTVQITNTRFGFSNKVFEVANWEPSFAPSGELGVRLELRELASTVYDWNAEESAFVQDNTTLPSPINISAPAITVSDELQTFNEKALSVLIIQVTGGSIYSNRFEVEAKKSTESEFIALGSSSATKFELVDVEDGSTYDVRARSISGFGTRSSFATASHQVVGKTAPPSDVTNLSANVVNGQVQLSWTPVTDLDLSHYLVRYQNVTTGASYPNSNTIAEKVARPANTLTTEARAGTYFVRAIDKLGIPSANPTSVVVTTDVLAFDALNVVSTTTENPAFSGTVTDAAVVDNTVVLGTSTLFDATAGNFDDGAGNFDGGFGNVVSSGSYNFANFIDLGAKHTSRVVADLTTSRLDYINLFDDATGNFDDRQGLFDGDSVIFDTTDVQLEVRTSDTGNNPSSSPSDWTAFQRFIVGDYSARSFDFRAVLTSKEPSASPVLSGVTVTIDMPDRIDTKRNIDSGGSGVANVTFNIAFKETPAIIVNINNQQAGDFYTITNESATGCTVSTFASGGGAANRNFDIMAKGFGRVIT